MFAQLKGKIIERNLSNNNFVLEVNDIGYLLDANLKTINQLALNSLATIYTHLSSNEHGIRLFGFLTRAEKEMFETLISVSGIGPKSALGILGVLDPQAIISSVIKEDVRALSSAPGLGKKTAEKLIIELRSKIKKLAHLSDSMTLDNHLYSSSSEVISILEGLGFDYLDIKSKLEKAKVNLVPDDAESIIRFCLK